MARDPQVLPSKIIEQCAVQRDLVAQLLHEQRDTVRAKARADRLRDLLKRVKDRNAN